MKHSAYKHTHLLAGVLGAAACFCSCDRAPAPAAPNLSAVNNNAGSTTQDAGSSGIAAGNDSSSSLGNASSEGGSNASPTPDVVGSLGNNESSTTPVVASGTVPASRGGAKVGSATDQATVTKCLGTDNFFDRFANNGAGNCTTLALAQIDCSGADAVKAILSANLKTQWDTAMSGDYSGFMIDQCLDCPPGGTAPECTSTAGTAQTGTKVFFVKADTATITGKALVLPVRPGQSGNTAPSPSPTASPSPSAAPH